MILLDYADTFALRVIPLILSLLADGVPFALASTIAAHEMGADMMID